MNLDSWDEDELLFVTGKDIRYFPLSSSTLSCSYRQNCCLWFPIEFNYVNMEKVCKKIIIIDDSKPALLRSDERPDLLPQNQFL